MKVTIIVITLNRPDYLRRCLACIYDQHPRPDQVIVVDSSSDDHSEKVAKEFSDTLYSRNETGFGRMTTSRNLGLRMTTGNIVAFLDDDAFAHPGWLEELIGTYTEPQIGAVGGRALNNQPGEATNGVDEIGRLKANGTISGNFAADPGKVVEVDHIMGCNMSFRREVIAQLGGFCEDYPGISGVREDTDMCLRVKRLGYRILFNPAACVDHVGAPQAVGQRFDARYMFFGMQNHCVMLQRNFGCFSPLLWRFLAAAFAEGASDFVRRVGGAVFRVGAVGAGLALGLGKAAVGSLRSSGSPIRTSSEAQELSALLARPVGSSNVGFAPETDSEATQTQGSNRVAILP